MKTYLSVLAVLLLPTVAFAHPGHTPHDALGGFLHPLTGLDHILAMVAVGLLASTMGGRARWLLPVSFLFAMTVGGVVSGLGVAVPFVEAMIIASVLCLGSMLALALRMSTPVTASLVALFAFFHGFAHIAEVGTHDAVLYGAGFLVATGLLHVAGFLLGSMTTRFSRRAMQSFGTVTVALGVLLSLGIL